MINRFTRSTYIFLVALALFPSGASLVKSSAKLAIVRIIDPDRYLRLGSTETFERLNRTIEDIKSLQLKQLIVCYSAKEGATSLYHLNALVKSDMHLIAKVLDERECSQYADTSIRINGCRTNNSKCLWLLDSRPPQLIQL